jgi:hypothetical protein
LCFHNYQKKDKKPTRKMPSPAAIFFNMVMRHKNPDRLLQLNPVNISITNIEIEPSCEDGTETKITKRQVEHAHMEFPEEDSKDRQVILVYIQVHYSTQNVDGSVTSFSSQHFNLVILEGSIAYLFEPLQEPTYAMHVFKMVASQFPDHKLVKIETHPQTSSKHDVFCLVYVLMLANAVLEHDDDSIIGIVQDLRFAHAGQMSRAKKYLHMLQEQIPGLPPCPVGAWASDHEGALVGGIGGGVVGGVVGGPWGLVLGGSLGALAGEVFVDAPHRNHRHE